MFEPGPSWIPPTNESTLDRLLRESLAGRRLVYSWDLGFHFGGCWPIKEIHRRLQHRAGGCTCQSCWCSRCIAGGLSLPLKRDMALRFSWDVGVHVEAASTVDGASPRHKNGCACRNCTLCETFDRIIPRLDLALRTTCPATMGGEHEFLDGLCRGCACTDKHWVEPALQREACPATMGGEHEFLDGLCGGCACTDELQREATQVETDGDGDQSSKGRKRPPQRDLEGTPNKRSKLADPAPAVFHTRNAHARTLAKHTHAHTHTHTHTHDEHAQHAGVGQDCGFDRQNSSAA